MTGNKVLCFVQTCWRRCWMVVGGIMCFPLGGMTQIVKPDSVAVLPVDTASRAVIHLSETISMPVREGKDTVRLMVPDLSLDPAVRVMDNSSSVLQPVMDSWSHPTEKALSPLPDGFSSDSAKQLNLTLNRPLVIPYYQHPSPLFRGDYDTGGVLLPFRYGALTGSGSQTTLPGIGLIQEAALGYRQQLGDRWMLQLGLQAHKFHFPYAVGQQLGTSARLQYQVSDRLAFRVFGSYGIGPSYGFSTRSYGGSIWMGITDRFSLEMGVQRQYNPLRGGWEMVPMLVPTYKFNKFDLGLDVGGLLHQLLHEVVIDNDRLRMGNPTIGPPTAFPR